MPGGFSAGRAARSPGLARRYPVMSIGVIAGRARDADISACGRDDRHTGAYFDHHLTTDPD